MTNLSTVDFSTPERRDPIRLHDLPWDQPTMLAPMEGITHPHFRDLMAARPGIGIVCTEFVRVSGKAVSGRHLRRQVKKSPGLPLSVQVMGSDPGLMAEAAAWVAEAGADVIDVNLGCPAPRVVRKGAGAAMLRDPKLLFEVLAAMRARVPGWMSAKIRAGFDDASRVVELARIIEASGVDFLVVHPRRRADFYEGVADWRIIRRLKEELRIPVVGNGDCWYAADALRMRRETGCDGVMIGRPALRNPWIFEQIAAMSAGREPVRPTGVDLLDFLRSIAESFCEEFGGGRVTLGKVKELVSYLGRTVDDDGTFRRRALRSQTLEELLDVADGVLSVLPPERLDLDARGTLGLERSGTTAAEDRSSG